MNPKPKFKIGDTVVCVGESYGDKEGDKAYGGFGWKKGRKFKVAEINFGFGSNIYWEGDVGRDVNGGVYEHHLELYNPLEDVIKAFKERSHL